VYNDVSGGIGVARRFPTGSSAIDLGVEPSVVAMHIEYDTAGPEGNSLQAAEVELRLDASARLSVPLGGHWVLTLTVDTGVVPALLISPVRLEATGGPQPPPAFPSWCGGLRLGAAGALL
jgi:hypothetical protein